MLFSLLVLVLIILNLGWAIWSFYNHRQPRRLRLTDISTCLILVECFAMILSSDPAIKTAGLLFAFIIQIAQLINNRALI